MMDEVLRQLRALRPVDAGRVDEVFPAEARALRVRAIVSGAPHAADARVRRESVTARRAADRPHRRLVGALALAAGCAVVVLAITGILDRGPTAAAPAQAEVIRGALHALQAGPGTILIESDTYFSRQAGGHQWYQRQDVIYQTPRGPGAQNLLTSEGPASTETTTINGVTEDWDPTTNTIYTNVALNPCGCRIKPGATPGTYRVGMLPVPHAPRGTGAWDFNQHLPAPLTITARQARALRRGAAQLALRPASATRDRRNVMMLTGAFRVESDTSQVQTALAQHRLTLRGRTTVAGRPALELATAAGALSDGYVRFYVDPRTYAPIKTVSRSGGDLSIITFHRYEVLPDTAANRRLLDLRYRHPTARIDSSHSDYLRARTQLSADSRKP